MSISVPIDILTKNQNKAIVNHLYINPEGEQVKNFGNKQYTYPKKVKGIAFTQLEGDNVLLPLFYAKKLLKQKQFPKKVYPEFDPEEHPFCIDLREDKYEPLACCLDHLKKYQTTSLKLYPGYGKTILGLLLWWYSRKYMLTMVESTTLLTQHLKVVLEAVPSLKDHVWCPGAGGVYRKYSKCPSLPMIIITMEDYVKKIPQEIIDNIGFLIIDEAHRFCTPSRVEPILAIHPKYVVIETATLGRKDKMHNMMYALVGFHSIFRVSKNPHTVIQYNTRCSPSPKKNSRGYTDFNDLQRLLAFDEHRNNLWLEFILNNPQRKFITLVYLTEHAHLLSQMATEAGIDHSMLCGNIKSYVDKRCLIGTISKIGTGFDEANRAIDFDGTKSDVLILMTSIKAEIQVKPDDPDKDPEDVSYKYSDEEIAQIGRWEQIRNRTRGENPYIIYFRDNHPIVKRHIDGITAWVYETKGKVLRWDSRKKLVL